MPEVLKANKFADNLFLGNIVIATTGRLFSTSDPRGFHIADGCLYYSDDGGETWTKDPERIDNGMLGAGLGSELIALTIDSINVLHFSVTTRDGVGNHYLYYRARGYVGGWTVPHLLQTVVPGAVGTRPTMIRINPFNSHIRMMWFSRVNVAENLRWIEWDFLVGWTGPTDVGRADGTATDVADFNIDGSGHRYLAYNVTGVGIVVQRDADAEDVIYATVAENASINVNFVNALSKAIVLAVESVGNNLVSFERVAAGAWNTTVLGATSGHPGIDGRLSSMIRDADDNLRAVYNQTDTILRLITFDEPTLTWDFPGVNVGALTYMPGMIWIFVVELVQNSPPRKLYATIIGREATFDYDYYTGFFGYHAPELTTDPPSNLVVVGDIYDIRLNGTIDAYGGDPCEVWFEHGLTVAYGNETAHEFGKVTADTFFADLTGLDRTLAYHYRAVARNSEGTSYGADVTMLFTDSYAVVAAMIDSSATIIDTTVSFIPAYEGRLAGPGAPNFMDSPIGVIILADIDVAIVSALGDASVNIIDVSNLALPALISRCDVSTCPVAQTQPALIGVDDTRTYLYVPSMDGSLSIWDISTLAAPVFVGQVSGAPFSVTYAARPKGSFCYVTDLDGAFISVDVTNPAAPVVADSVISAPAHAGIALYGDYAIVGTDVGTVKVFDISNPYALALLYTVNVTPASGVWDLVVKDDYAYVPEDTGLISVLDLTPLPGGPPVVVGTVTVPTQAMGIGISEFTLVVVDGNDTLYVISVGDPTSPSILGSLSGIGAPNYLGGCFGVGVFSSPPVPPPPPVAVPTITTLPATDVK